MNPQAYSQLFAGAGASTVFEAAGQSGLVDASFERIRPGSRAAGPARTVRCAPRDNLMVHAVMETVEPGEVLVLTFLEPEPYSLLGALLALQAQAHGAAAVLVDGGVRDADELREMEMPVWARWITPRSCEKRTPGTIGEPVTVGGVVIAPGDFVVLDGDGVVVVPARDVEGVAEGVRLRVAREAALMPRLKAGEITLDIHGLRPLLER